MASVIEISVCLFSVLLKFSNLFILQERAPKAGPCHLFISISYFEHNQNVDNTSGRGPLWGPALGVVKTLHTDNKQHKENMKVISTSGRGRLWGPAPAL